MTDILSVDTKAAAAMTGMSASYLRNARCYRPEAAPTSFKVGRRVLYPLNGPAGLRAWVEQRTRESLSPEAAQ